MKRQRIPLVNKKVQLGLTFRFLSIMFLFALFIGFQVYITVWPVVSHLIPEDLMVFVEDQLLFRLALFSLPIIFVFAGFSIVFTHRIAGPIHRIGTTIEQMARGEDVEEVRLRKTDEFQDLASRLNELIRVIKASKTPKNPE